MYKLTAADFADTGQWRLLLKIGNVGLEAFLENMLHPEIEPQALCSASWAMNKDKLRENIEEAVYSNPRLLDDFATRIILYDPRTLFIPTEIAEGNAGAEEDIYRQVYTAEESDIMTDVDRDLTAAWSPAPGVKSFLMRTFPGARITCNLMERVRHLRKEGQGLRLYALARGGEGLEMTRPGVKEVDMILLEDENLISASTQEWQNADDIAYLALNLLDVYGYKPEEAEIRLEGFEPDSPGWKRLKGK